MSDKQPVDRRNRVITSLFWAFLEKCGTQGISLVINILLARLLDPEHYGAVAIITIFTGLARCLVYNGFNVALIQNKDVTNADYSSVFCINIISSILLYICLYIVAPSISMFFEMSELTAPFRVMALVVFPVAWQSIQSAKCMREMDFKRLFRCNVISAFLSGALSVWMAYKGTGVWALVVHELLCSIISCIVMFFMVRWRPQAILDFKRVRILFSYGWKVLMASVLDVFYSNVSGLVIGKKYSADTLAFYSKGQIYPQKIITIINDTIQNVMLPAISAEQDDKEMCKAMMRRSMTLSCFVIFPAMAGLAATATPLVSILLTDKWLPAVPFLQISCLNFAFFPVHTANLQAMKAMGRSDVYLKLEVVKKVIGITGLAVALLCFDDVLAIVWGAAIIAPVTLLINAVPNKRILGYSFLEQMKDILPSLLIACGMFAIVLSVELLNLSMWLTLVIQVLVGVGVYVGVSKLFKLETYTYLLTTIKTFWNKRKS